MNQMIPDRDRWLRVPELQFNRKIGQWAHQHWTVEGEEAGAGKYEEYLTGVLPQPAHYAALREIFKDPDWIAAKKSDAPDTG
jgi:hypothetical protein